MREFALNLPSLEAIQAEISRRAAARDRLNQEREAELERASEVFRTDWAKAGRPEQKLPTGDWLTWLILAGRGFGKTRTGAESVRALVCGDSPLSRGQYGRVALIAETAADARDIMVEGQSGLLAIHPKMFRPVYQPSKRRVVWPNGAVATLYNAIEPDQLRGPQHDLAWCDELAKWHYAEETWDQLQFGLRLGEKPRQIVTTTPRPIPVVRRIMASLTTVVTRGSTFDNRANLAASFFSQVVSRYEGTRLGRQELDAEILDDVPGGLWMRAVLDGAKLSHHVELVRVVVAIDPSGTAGDDDGGDEVGMIVAGKGIDGRCYVLADLTCKLGPAGWAARAVRAYHDFGADRIVAERNYGGAMVESTIRTADPNVAYREVVASRGTGGKSLRAEPVAALYEQGRVSHVGAFPQLEDQMCLMAGEGYIGKGSPDRVDALVWAVTDLMLAKSALAFGAV